MQNVSNKKQYLTKYKLELFKGIQFEREFYVFDKDFTFYVD